jgi:hypothetical protein
VIEVILRPEWLTPGKNTGFHNLGEVGMGGKVPVEDDAGFFLSLDERLLAHAVIYDYDNDNSSNNEYNANAYI